MNAPATSDDCCSAWPRIRPALHWFELDAIPGVLVMPTIRERTHEITSSTRVNNCPACGAERRSAIWNLNTHPRP